MKTYIHLQKWKYEYYEDAENQAQTNVKQWSSNIMNAFTFESIALFCEMETWLAQLLLRFATAK